MIHIDDIPDDSEFNQMFKRLFRQSIEDGTDSFSMVVRGDGKCFEADKAPGISTTYRNGLKVTRIGGSR